MADIDAAERELAARLGADAVTRDPALRALVGQDIFYRGDAPALIVRPTSAAAVAATVAAAARNGAHVVTRGGGMSYSGGYLSPDPATAILIDMRGMNRILAIDGDDMTVVVEPGVTWESLHTALAPLGLRAAWWGTLSGRKSTVGGGISQNAIFWGSGRTGSAVDAVVGLEVVTGTGEIVRTGSMGVAGAGPSFRHFGPDLSGLFTADAGAMGIKTAIALRLLRAPARSDGLSFLLPDVQALCGLMAQAARAGLVAQQMGLDDGLKAARMASGGLREDLATLWQVARGGRTLLGGIGQAARIASAGRGLLDGMPFSAHLFVEADSAAAIAAAKAGLRRIAAGQGAREVPPSVPQAMLATPFPPLNGLTGPRGERWVPVHCVVPLSKAVAAHAAIAAVFAAHGEAMARHGIGTSWLFTTIGNHAFAIEPMFFWPDALDLLHRDTLGAQRLARFAPQPDAPAARALVAEIRNAIVAAVDAIGALHIQLGSFYPYAERLDPGAAALSRGVRQLLDPQSIINPQSLGG